MPPYFQLWTYNNFAEILVAIRRSCNIISPAVQFMFSAHAPPALQSMLRYTTFRHFKNKPDFRPGDQSWNHKNSADVW